MPMRKIIREDFTSATSIAGVPHRALGGEIKRRDKKKAKKDKKLTFIQFAGQEVANRRRIEAMNEDAEFNANDVIAKLKAVDNEQQQKQMGTVVFGLEDDKGNIVKVRVNKDQADEFESALESMLDKQQALYKPQLSQDDGDVNEFDPDQHGMDVDDDVVTGMEISEIIFKLKDQFDIVDVEYPRVETDEEEETPLANPDDAAGGDELGLGDEEGAEGAEGEGGEEELDLGDEEGGEGDEDLEMTAGEEDMGGEESTEASALQQVIDYLKADAEARKAEAESRAAEAKANAQKYSMQAAEARVKQEEEFLDMEDYQKKQAEKEKEEKRLAQLAKYRRDVAGAAQSTLESTNFMAFLKSNIGAKK